MTHCLKYFKTDEDGIALLVDDDGRTCYAYLLDENGEIVGDCWLYNHGSAPVNNEWYDPKNMPFANTDTFVNSELMMEHEPIKSSKEVRVEWGQNGVDVFIRNQLFAHLRAGAKPGWSLLAAKDGPLARRLSG